MADSFHPYNQWLSLPVELNEPNHYQLLGLREFESDEETIAIAADRALAKVRGYRPGVHAKAWSQLLDELYGAKTCLLDSGSRAEYDRGLRGRNSTDKAALAVTNPVKSDRLPPTINPDRYPPGMGPKQHGAAHRPGSDPAKSTPDNTEPKHPSVAQPATSRPTPPLASAEVRSDSGPAETAKPASVVGMPAPTIPVAYPVYPQMAGYVPQAGYAPPAGYTPPYGYPPGAASGYVPAGLPYAVPPSAPPGSLPAGYAAPNPYGGAIDPMAPVSIPGMSQATGASAPVGMASLSGAIPVGTAVPVGAVSGNVAGTADVDWGTTSGAESAARAAAPVEEAAAVGASAKALAMRNARRAEQARQNLLFLAGAAGIAALAAGGIYFSMSGGGGTNSNSTTVALHTQPDPTNDAPVPMARSLESELPGGTPRRAVDRSTNSTPPVNTKTSTEPPVGSNPEGPGPTGLSPNPGVSSPAAPGAATPLPEMTAPAEASPPLSVPTESVPTAEQTPLPQVPTPETATAPNPLPVPTAEPMPASEPTPPIPSPAPERPAPASPQQLAALAEALAMGRAALTEQNFAEADKFIARAAELAQADGHQQMVGRLREVGEYVKQFRSAVEAGAKDLETKDLQVGTSAFVSFVEVLPDRVIVRTAGQNRNYPYAELPPGLAQAIVDQTLDGSDPTSRVVKGAYYAVARGDRKTLLEKAQAWWEEAQLGGVDIAHLMPFLTDDYESVKSAGASNRGNPAAEPARE